MTDKFLSDPIALIDEDAASRGTAGGFLAVVRQKPDLICGQVAIGADAHGMRHAIDDRDACEVRWEAHW